MPVGGMRALRGGWGGRWGRAEPKSLCFGKFGMRLYSWREQTASRFRALRMEAGGLEAAGQGWKGQSGAAGPASPLS